MSLLDIFQTANSNMMRSKLRSFLTIIAVFIGALTLTLTNGIGSGISSYIDEQLGNLGAENVLIIQPQGDALFSTDGPQEYDPNRTIRAGGDGPSGSTVVLTQKDLDTVLAEPGIEEAYFDIATAPDYIEGVNGTKFSLAASPWTEGSNIQLDAGSLPSNKDPERELLISRTFSDAMGYATPQDAVGATVELGIKDPTGTQEIVEATVIGVQSESLIANAGAMINRSLSEALNEIQTRGLPEERKNQFTSITAEVDPNISDEDFQAIKDSLDEKGYTATTFQDQIGIFKQVIDAVILVLNIFAGIALLAASFGIVNTLFMAVQERTKEIGLMKAMGMSSNKVFTLFSVEAILLGFWGSLLGSLAGIGIGAIANSIASNTFLQDLVGFELTSFPFTSVLVIMLIIMSIAFLAGTLPARRAAQKDPIEALRYE